MVESMSQTTGLTCIYRMSRGDGWGGAGCEWKTATSSFSSRSAF